MSYFSGSNSQLEKHMDTNFVEELCWRGMLHDIMPETEELLTSEMVSLYGFDPIRIP